MKPTYWMQPNGCRTFSEVEIRCDGIDTTGWTPLVALTPELSALVKAAREFQSTIASDSRNHANLLNAAVRFGISDGEATDGESASQCELRRFAANLLNANTQLHPEVARVLGDHWHELFDGPATG